MFNGKMINNSIDEDETYNKLLSEVMDVDYTAFYRGTVVDNYDPQGLGRIRVRIPQIYGTEEQSETDENIYVANHSIPWATSAIMAGAGNNTGAYLIPNIGDTVLVTFEGGDPNLPLYFGGLLTRGGSGKFIGSKDVNNNELYEASDMDFNTDLTNGSQRVIYKSIKGATIIIDDNDGDESIKIIDQLGQFISLENIGSEALGRDRSGGIESRERSGRIVIKDAYEDSIDLHNGEIHIKTPKIVIETDDIEQVGYEDRYPEEVDYADRILGDEDEPTPPEPEDVTWYFSILGLESGKEGWVSIFSDGNVYEYPTPVSITKPNGFYCDVTFTCDGYQSLSTTVTFDKDADTKETVVSLEPIPVTYGNLIIHNDTDLPILVGVILDVDDNYQSLTEFNNTGAFYPGGTFSLQTLYDTNRVFSVSIVSYDLLATYNYFVSFDSNSTDKTLYASDILDNGCYYSNARVLTYEPEVESESSHYTSLMNYGKMELINNTTGEKYYNILRPERVGYNNYEYACFSFGSMFTFFWNYDTITRDPEREDYLDYIGFHPMTDATRGINIDLSSDTPFKIMVPIKNGIYTCNLISSDGTINNQSTLYVFGPNDSASSYKSGWNVYASKSATYFMPISRDINILSTIYNKQIFVPGTYQYTGESPVIIQTGYYDSSELGNGISFGINSLQSSSENARCITIYAGLLGSSGELDESFRCMYAGNWFTPLTTSGSPQPTTKFFKPRGVLTSEDIERQLTFFYTYETHEGPEPHPTETRTITFANDSSDSVAFGLNFSGFTDLSDFNSSTFDQIVRLVPNATTSINVLLDENSNWDYYMVSFIDRHGTGNYSFQVSYNNLVSWENTDLTSGDFKNGYLGTCVDSVGGIFTLKGYSSLEISRLYQRSAQLQLANIDTGEVFIEDVTSDEIYFDKPQFTLQREYSTTRQSVANFYPKIPVNVSKVNMLPVCNYYKNHTSYRGELWYRNGIVSVAGWSNTSYGIDVYIADMPRFTIPAGIYTFSVKATKRNSGRQIRVDAFTEQSWTVFPDVTVPLTEGEVAHYTKTFTEPMEVAHVRVQLVGGISYDDEFEVMINEGNQPAPFQVSNNGIGYRNVAIPTGNYRYKVVCPNAQDLEISGIAPILAPTTIYGSTSGSNNVTAYYQDLPKYPVEQKVELIQSMTPFVNEEFNNGTCSFNMLDPVSGSSFTPRLCPTFPDNLGYFSTALKVFFGDTSQNLISFKPDTQGLSSYTNYVGEKYGADFIGVKPTNPRNFYVMWYDVIPVRQYNVNSTTTITADSDVRIDIGNGADIVITSMRVYSRYRFTGLRLYNNTPNTIIDFTIVGKRDGVTLFTSTLNDYMANNWVSAYGRQVNWKDLVFPYESCSMHSSPITGESAYWVDGEPLDLEITGTVYVIKELD